MSKRSARPNEFHIAVAVSPGRGLSLDADIDLLKAAIVYGDHVTLYSPSAAMLASVAGVAWGDKSTRRAFFRELIAAEAPERLAIIDSALNKPRGGQRSRRQLVLAGQIDRLLRETVENELQPVAEETLTRAGMDQVAPVLENGLVELDPFIVEGDGSTDEAVERWFAELQKLLTDPFTYPLFDDDISRLVRAAVGDGSWATSEPAVRHGQQAGAAQLLFGHLPTFPGASLNELLDLRDHLEEPLVRFRSAMVQATEGFQAAAYEPDFDSEVKDLWVRDVAPAMDQIRRGSQEAGFVNRFRRHATSGQVLAAAGALTFGVVAWTELPELLSAGVFAGAEMVGAMSKAYWERHDLLREVKAHQFYLLHELDDQLESRQAG